MKRRTFLGSASSAMIAGLIANKSVCSNQELRQIEVSRSPEPVVNDTWTDIRQQFRMTDELTYFNTGGIGPTPTAVLKTVSDTMHELQIRTNHGHNLIEAARPVIAGFVGCDPNELAFSRNATEGNSTVASGLRLKSGDEVIIDSHSHQGGSIAWMTRQKYDGLVVRIFDPDPVDVQSNVERIQSLINSRTKVIQVSQVTAPTGIRMPVEEIGLLAQAHKLWFHIDGAQALGMYPFKVRDLNCDSFAACCHKWMCGPLGSGVLFVKAGRLDDVTPTDVGAYADAEWDLPRTLTYADSARRFECGTRDSASLAGVGETVQFLNRLDMTRIATHGLDLAGFLHRNLSEIKRVSVLSPTNEELRSSMISFSVDGKTCDEVFGELMKAGFRCRPVRERNLNALRVSTHLFNSQAECENLLAEVVRLYG